jgi:hypothetical protein
VYMLVRMVQSHTEGEGEGARQHKGERETLHAAEMLGYCRPTFLQKLQVPASAHAGTRVADLKALPGTEYACTHCTASLCV